MTQGVAGTPDARMLQVERQREGTKRAAKLRGPEHYKKRSQTLQERARGYKGDDIGYDAAHYRAQKLHKMNLVCCVESWKIYK